MNGDTSLSELVIGGVLGAIAWIISRAASRHIESLDQLTASVNQLRTEVARLTAIQDASRDQMDKIEDRLTRAEARGRGGPGA